MMRARLIRSGLALTFVFASLALAPVASQASTAAPAPTGATAPGSAAPYVLEDGKTKPVYSYENAIRESVWVKAPDFDGDGEKDLVTVDIVRPRELDGETKVPVI